MTIHRRDKSLKENNHRNIQTTFFFKLKKFKIHTVGLIVSRKLQLFLVWNMNGLSSNKHQTLTISIKFLINIFISKVSHFISRNIRDLFNTLKSHEDKRRKSVISTSDPNPARLSDISLSKDDIKTVYIFHRNKFRGSAVVLEPIRQYFSDDRGNGDAICISCQSDYPRLGGVVKGRILASSKYKVPKKKWKMDVERLGFEGWFFAGEYNRFSFRLCVRVLIF